MKLEIHAPVCEHPFGDGIHVIKCQGTLAAAMMEALEVRRDVGEGYQKLAGMLDDRHERATMCSVLQGEPPEGMSKAWMVIRMVLTADASQEHGHSVDVKALTIMAEEGYEELALTAARGFKLAFKSL
jgi:hypothetical protein